MLLIEIIKSEFTKLPTELHTPETATWILIHYFFDISSYLLSSLLRLLFAWSLDK